MRGSLNRHELKMRKGKLWAKWPVQTYNLNFAFSSSVDWKGSLIMKSLQILLFWWFSSHSKSNIGEGFLGWGKEKYEGKGEEIVLRLSLLSWARCTDWMVYELSSLDWTYLIKPFP